MKSATVRRIAQEIKTTFDQLIRTYLVIVKWEKDKNVQNQKEEERVNGKVWHRGSRKERLNDTPDITHGNITLTGTRSNL